MGGIVGALDCYQRANVLSPSNPLCYINAARSYQLLNQLRSSEMQLQTALRMDPSLAMARMGLSQNLLLTGNAKQAFVLLDEALRFSKQVCMYASMYACIGAPSWSLPIHTYSSLCQPIYQTLFMILTTFTTILLYTSPHPSMLCCTFLQVSEIRDVLTARTIALMQLDFERKGLIPKDPDKNRV